LLFIENSRLTDGRVFVCVIGPASEFILIGLNTLLYRAGSELCFLLGDRVFPTSKALSVSGIAAGAMLIVFGFDSDAAEGPTLGDAPSGSKAAPGSFREGGGLPLIVEVSSSGGLPAMLP
jgi:hypothetical protein